MKKTVRMMLAAMIVLAICGCALAETVHVSISTGDGRLAMAYAPVEASDLDGDGTLTIDEVLYCAHEAAYEGGAAAGYVSEETEYGKSMYRLWGEENGGSYGYYVNDASGISLLDPVKEGDHVKAYAYQDLEAWGDVYTCFQVSSAEMNAGDSMTLTLTAFVFDADWNLVSTPVEGAVITINGEDSEFVSNADGCCAITLAEAGEYVISARSDSMTLVPPVCVVTVK